MNDYQKLVDQLRARAELKCQLITPGACGTGVYLSIPAPDQSDAVLLRAAADAIEQLRVEATFHQAFQLAFYDEEEIHENCTVTIWKNSITGEQSIGWQENEQQE